MDLGKLDLLALCMCMPKVSAGFKDRVRRFCADLVTLGQADDGVLAANTPGYHVKNERLASPSFRRVDQRRKNAPSRLFLVKLLGQTFRQANDHVTLDRADGGNRRSSGLRGQRTDGLVERCVAGSLAIVGELAVLCIRTSVLSISYRGRLEAIGFDVRSSHP